MKTGKTTSATMLVSLLNGDTNEANIARYSSTLANEMQVKSFAVPKISECNAVLMDECFFADMGKMYADFKRFITSSNGRARLPYGQEFEWTGQPNYIATSNDSLQKFIKDWSDRRYLSVEFKAKPTERLDFDEIKALWASFVLNSTCDKDWSTWAEELAPVSEEKGDRTEVTEELEIDLRKLAMIERILALSTPSKSPACAQNHVALKTFVDWFSESMGTVEAHKRKAEIEAAVIKVYGARYSTSNYWLLSNLQDTAQKMKNEINNPAATDADANASAQAEPETDDLPF
jgi:predicted P-loop ATPase